MNTTSNYKQTIGGKNETIIPKQLTIKDSLNVTSFPTHIKINSPSIIQDNCSLYTYDIDKTLNTNMHQLPSKPKVVSFCIYRIITCKNRERPSHPFLQYLLYKYPSNIKNTNDTLVFPFIKYKSESILKLAKKFTTNVTGIPLTIKGFIEYKNEVYLFFDFHENKDMIVENINLKKRDDKLWWCLIDEICNIKKVLNFPIHPSVYKTFYSNPALIYLKNNDNKRIESPIVGYYGNYYKFVPIVAALSSQNSIRGQLNNNNLFYFSSFRKAIRYGAWSPLYKERIAYNKKVTDIDGKYIKGGIVRFAIFLGKVDIPIDSSYENISKLLNQHNMWNTAFDSMLIGSVDYDDVKLNINPEYILKDNHQYLSLSYHEIDQKTIGPLWDPRSKNYTIV